MEDMRGYLGVVAASPRGGKWLILKDDGREVRRSEHEIREYDPSQDCSPAYEKWLEKREFRWNQPPKGGFFFLRKKSERNK